MGLNQWLFFTTMNCRFMVERNSVVMEDFEVEDVVVHFFTITGRALMPHLWEVKYLGKLCKNCKGFMAQIRRLKNFY